MEPADVLEGQTVWAKAKAVLWERGWHQGDFSVRDPKWPSRFVEGAPVCIAGACNAAAGVPLDNCDGTIIAIEAHLLRTARIDAQGVGDWNDYTATFNDVLDVLDELDKAERAGDEAKP